MDDLSALDKVLPHLLGPLGLIVHQRQNSHLNYWMEMDGILLD